MTSAGARQRIYQLDAVRGLLAIGVAVYHVAPGPATAILGTWGVYAFFVLSGWAMEHVYGAAIDVRRFAVARVARLAPLWIPVVLISAFAYDITDPVRIALNLTGVFGFVSPGATSIVTGGWSIGIEVVCYVMFAVLAVWRLETRALAVLAAAGVALRFVAVGGLMPVDLEASWVAYTVPSSFLGFFLVGMLAARTVRLPSWSGRRARAAAALGDLSYGTYLLHPLVAMLVGPLTVLVTPPLAWLIYRLYEAPLRHFVADQPRGGVIAGAVGVRVAKHLLTVVGVGARDL